jgi:spindle assembly abnormal protein 6
LFSDYENKLDELNRKIDNLSFENKKLEEIRRNLENSEKELLKKKELLENELKYFKSDAESLKSENISFNKTTFSQEKFITELNIKNELFQKQLDEKEKNIQNLNNLVENLTSQKNHLDDSLKILRSTNSKLEDKLNTSINEINKGNDIIQKLQVNLI